MKLQQEVCDLGNVWMIAGAICFLCFLNGAGRAQGPSGQPGCSVGVHSCPCVTCKDSVNISLQGGRPAKFFFLGAFAKSRKATLSLVMSVCPHETTRVPLDGFSCSFVGFFFFEKSVQKIKVCVNSVWLNSEKNNWHLTRSDSISQ
jgi:hypothetical protein